MNNYKKYCPNVFIAECTEQHEKGEEIIITTKYGKEHECIIYNFVGYSGTKENPKYCYSITRSDGFNAQERARKKAEKLQGYANNADQKSKDFYKKSHAYVEHIPFGQPILVGHHSEGRHRRAIDNSWNAMGKSVELSDKAEEYERRAEYWKRRENEVNLSMPESLEFYLFKLEQAKKIHQEYKEGTRQKEHSFSLTYAKKTVNEIEKKLELARKLWE